MIATPRHTTFPGSWDSAWATATCRGHGVLVELALPLAFGDYVSDLRAYIGVLQIARSGRDRMK